MTTYRSSWLSPAPTDDYFTAVPASPSHHHDDSIYRFSGVDRGTPTIGIYAQDGIWDEDDSMDQSRTTRNSMAISGGPSSGKTSTRGGSTKGRSRSGTVSTVKEKEKDEDKHGTGMWGWARRGRESHSPATTVVMGEKSPEERKIKKKESKMLKGKGRHGELSVVVDPNMRLNFQSSTPPLPTKSSALETPITSSPAFFTPATHQSRHDENSPLTPGKRSSTWKKGVQKIFRSKSSIALRELSNEINTATPPPVPSLPLGVSKNLPHPPKGGLGKPFSTSTPPPSSIRGTEPFSPTSQTGAATFGLHPEYPSDPFSSRLDYATPLERPKLPKSSPSLRNLKDLVIPKSKLAKTKSMANLKQPNSAPPMRTEFPPLDPVPIRKMASMASFKPITQRRSSLSPALAYEPTDIKPIANIMPAESPPLLPPNPSFFPFSSASMTPVHSTDASSSSSSVDLAPSRPTYWSAPTTPMTPAPSAPLPPLPTTQPLMTRSGSSHKLLPRSRSTSMSLKSPPTSSSFFDLYEQLGIWPTPDKDKLKGEGSTELAPEPARKESDLGVTPVANVAASASPATSDQARTISASSSAAFSTSSWEAAINAFPMVDPDRSSTVKDDCTETLDNAGDQTMESVFSNIAVAAISPSSSQTHTLTASSCTAGPSRSATQTQQHGRAARSGRNSGKAGWSESSSRDSSSERRASHGQDKWLESSTSDESAEEDDVPLSKLHPGALEARKEKKERSKAIKMSRARARANQVKLVGRNPGAETGWNGEGGIPADVLWQRLERVSVISTGSQSTLTAPTAPAPTSVPPPSITHEDRYNAHARAQTDPVQRRPRPAAITTQMTMFPEMMTDARLPSPLAATHGSSSTRREARAREATYPQVHPNQLPIRQTSITSQVSRQQSGSSNSHSTHSHSTHIAPRLPPIPIESPATISLSRSSTVQSKKSVMTRQRSRSTTNLRHGQANDENMVRVRESMPHERPAHIPAVLGTIDGRKVTVEVYPDTTARQILEIAARNFAADLGELERGMSWVIVELFAELGCERYVREYEVLCTVIKGWEIGAKFNCLIVKQSNRGVPTWQRAIPQTAPYLGSWVQYETKKGKWSKRWLETRGGQVFLAKNEKNKDEFQINTLFFDVYQITRPYPSPKPFVFMLKRILDTEIASPTCVKNVLTHLVDAAASFENPEEYMHVFCAEEGIAFKLMSAIYDAKSFALKPHLASRPEPGQAVTQTPPQLPGQIRRPTLPAGPLVDIQKNQHDRSGFTGKGLLRL